MRRVLFRSWRSAIAHLTCASVAGAVLKMSNGTQPCARAAASRQMGSPVTGSAMASRAAIQCDFQGEFASVTLSVTWPYCQRSEEHTSELQSLMRTSYAVFCLKKKKPSTQ